MAEATGATVLTKSDSDSGNVTSLSEESSNSVLGSVETNVSAENTGRLSGSSGSGSILSWLLTRELNSNLATAVSVTVLGINSGSSTGVVVVLDEGNSS